MKKVNKQFLLDIPCTVRVSEKTKFWQVIVQKQPLVLKKKISVESVLMSLNLQSDTFVKIKYMKNIHTLKFYISKSLYRKIT